MLGGRFIDAAAYYQICDDWLEKVKPRQPDRAIGRVAYRTLRYDVAANRLYADGLEPTIVGYDAQLRPIYDFPDRDISPRDVAFVTRVPAADEEGAIAEVKTLAGVDDSVQVVFLLDEGPDEAQPAYWRIGGLGDSKLPGYIFIREALYNRCRNDQERADLLRHEDLHRNNVPHAEAKAAETNPSALTQTIQAQFGDDRDQYGGINVTGNSVNLETSGKGKDLIVNNGRFMNRPYAENYTGLVPKVISLNDLPQADLSAMLKR
jgi:hypothetical protein